MRRFISYAAIVLLAVSCGKGPDGDVPCGDEIVFSAPGFVAEVVTKAASAVTTLTSFDVLCVTGTAGTDETTVWNATFSGTTSFTGGRYWPLEDQGYMFYASNAAMTASKTGPTVTVDNGTDVVCATCLAPSYKRSNALTFEHIFARIGYFNISAPSGYTISDLKVTVTPKIGGVYDILRGAGKTDGTGWSSVVTGSQETVCTETGSTADSGIYLVPGDYTFTVSYVKKKGDYMNRETAHGTVSLVGGKINNITAAISGGGEEEIELRLILNEWGVNELTLRLD